MALISYLCIMLDITERVNYAVGTNVSTCIDECLMHDNCSFAYGRIL